MKTLIKNETLTLATRKEMRDGNYGYPLTRPDGDWQSPDGYTYVDDLPKPEPQDGYRWVRKLTSDEYGWEEIAIVIPDPVYGEVSKRIFFKRMTALGKWRQFKQLIKQDESVKDLYDNSAGLDINDPDVIALSPAIKSELGLSDEEYQSLFLVN